MNSIQRDLIVLLTLLAGPTLGSEQGARTEPIFLDTQFRRGFLLSYPDSSQGRSVEAVLDFDDEDNVPVWRLCQWGTKRTLAGARCTRSNATDLSYENEAKRIVVGGPVSEHRNLVLCVRGEAEYGARARKPGESWPHLLVEQDAIQLYRLDEVDEIQFQIGLRLLHSTNHMSRDDYDPGLHAAQFQMFFIIKNIRPGSDDHGDFYWFGVPFYDSRHDLPPAYMAKDAGKGDATGKFICSIDGRTVNRTPLKEGRWVTLQKDLLPHIQSGLREAVARGYLKNADPHDYAISNMNLGWEIPGTFDVAIQVRDFSVSAVLRAEGHDRVR